MPIEGLVIRAYERRDLSSVWALHEEGLRDTGTLVGVYRRDLHRDLAAIESWYMKSGGHFWIAEVEGMPVGMVGVEVVDGETGKLRQMRVTGALRRKGIGQRLLETAETFCREQGFHRFILETNALQTAAQHLYERNGFIRTCERAAGPFRVFEYQKELR